MIRNFNSVEECELTAVVEPSEERRAFVEKSFPGLRCDLDFNEVINDPNLDAVVIATPAHLHFEQTKQALLSGKHVLVEKPMATKLTQAHELADIAAANGLILMSGHTFLYNDAVRFIKKEIDSGNLGQIRYLYSQRLNLGRIRSDVDALWNFAPHDVSIFQFLLGDPDPVEINCFGMDFVQKGTNDVVFLNLRYDEILANIHVSWLDPLKTRKLVIVGSKKMIVYDDVAEDKITVYDKGIDKFSNLGEDMDFDTTPQPSFRYRSGDIWIPRIDYREPLRREAEHFLGCIREGKEPLSGPSHSLKVIGILEKASSF